MRRSRHAALPCGRRRLYVDRSGDRFRVRDLPRQHGRRHRGVSGVAVVRRRHAGILDAVHAAVGHAATDNSDAVGFVAGTVALGRCAESPWAAGSGVRSLPACISASSPLHHSRTLRSGGDRGALSSSKRSAHGGERPHVQGVRQLEVHVLRQRRSSRALCWHAHRDLRGHARALPGAHHGESRFPEKRVRHQAVYRRHGRVRPCVGHRHEHGRHRADDEYGEQARHQSGLQQHELLRRRLFLPGRSGSGHLAELQQRRNLLLRRRGLGRHVELCPQAFRGQRCHAGHVHA